DRARRELTLGFAEDAWRVGRWSAGVLGGLGARERVVRMLRLYEGLPEEQTASPLGLPEDLVRTLYARATASLRRTRP
ncbi:hypothetical protein ACIOEX_17445, partial [Streptomyces sp. NPDC087850]